VTAQQVNLSGFLVKSVLSSCELLLADSSQARQLLNDAEHELENLISDKEKAENDVLEIFNVHGFGAEGEWKKLDRTCLEKDAGECVYFFLLGPLPNVALLGFCSYTYEVCLFGEAKQKPNHGGTTFSLGSVS